MKDFEEKKYWGISSSIDLYDCNSEFIQSKEKIYEYVVKLCDLIEMKRFGDCTIVHFGEDDNVAGYSMTQLIETSLISGHFANKSRAVYLDIFSCKLYKPEVVKEFSKEFFRAKKSVLQYIFRK